VAGAAQGAGLPDHKGMGWRQAGGEPGRPLRRPPEELGALASARQGTPLRGPPCCLVEVKSCRQPPQHTESASRPAFLLACLLAPARVGTAEPGWVLHPLLACFLAACAAPDQLSREAASRVWAAPCRSGHRAAWHRTNIRVSLLIFLPEARVTDAPPRRNRSPR